MDVALTPARRGGAEILDAPDVAPALLRRSIRDVARSNALFGGTRAVLRELEPLFAVHRGEAMTLLDAGTGAADIPRAAKALAARYDVALTAIGVDVAAPLAAAAAGRLDQALLADVRALPLRARSVDVVVCSQLLHHFQEHPIGDVVRELDRVARRRVVVSDLRRSWVAAIGFWLASWPLRFHPVTRHDGVLSVLRGFTPAELRGHVARATGVRPVVRRRLGWRITAAWSPRAESASR